MTLRIRRLLLLGLFIVFVPLSAGVILYSNGWRFNPKNFSFQKTGAIYIETEPKGVSIEIDKKTFPDKSGFIQSGTLIPNLVPKNYEIKITKQNYLPYYKNLKVEPSLAAELIYVILIPEKIKPETVIASQLKGDEIVEFSPDSKKIITKNTKNIYYLSEIGSQTALNINASFENFKKGEIIKKVAFHPFDQNKLLIESDNIYSLNTDRLKLEPIVQLAAKTEKNKILAWEAKNSSLYYLKESQKKGKAKSSELVYFNLILKTENIFKLPENIDFISLIDVSKSSDKVAFLDSRDDLYVFDIQGQKSEKIAHNAKKFQFSPDGEKIAFLDKDGKINVLFFKDWQKNIKKKAGDVIGYNLKNKEVIENIFWYKDSFHLFVQYQNQNLDFIEIDDRLPLNQYSLAQTIKNPYYNLKDNFLYYIKENKLYFLEL